MKEYEVVVTTYDEAGNWIEEDEPITVTARSEKEAIAKVQGKAFTDFLVDEVYTKVVAEYEYIFFVLNNDYVNTDTEDRYYCRIWIKDGE